MATEKTIATTDKASTENKLAAAELARVDRKGDGPAAVNVEMPGVKHGEAATSGATSSAMESNAIAGAQAALSAKGKAGRAAAEEATQAATAMVASGSLDALVQAQAIMAEGLRTAMQDWVDYNQSTMQRWMERMQASFRIRTPNEVLTNQSELAREEMSELLRQSIRATETMNKAAGDAVRRLSARSAD